MTGFGLYLVIVMFLNVCAAFYYAGQGGMHSSSGVLIFGACWTLFNIAGIILWGTGFGV